MSNYTSGENDDYDEKSQVRTRMHGPDREALDRIGENHPEWSNRSEVIRGLIRDRDAGTTVDDDGGATEGPTTYTPTRQRQRAVYEAALELVDSRHELHEDQLGSLATRVSNDDATVLSPDKESIDRLLRNLDREGYAFCEFTVGSIRDSEGTTTWHIKPATAVPTEWRWNRENVEERRRKRQRHRRKVKFSPVEDSDSTPVDTEQWLADEQDVATDGGRDE